MVFEGVVYDGATVGGKLRNDVASSRTIITGEHVRRYGGSDRGS
jgi:hypothetical protein